MFTLCISPFRNQSGYSLDKGKHLLCTGLTALINGHIYIQQIDSLAGTANRRTYNGPGTLLVDQREGNLCIAGEYALGHQGATVFPYGFQEPMRYSKRNVRWKVYRCRSDFPILRPASKRARHNVRCRIRGDGCPAYPEYCSCCLGVLSQ
jgi:hypothetical protein